jgi:hypothetical protein
MTTTLLGATTNLLGAYEVVSHEALQGLPIRHGFTTLRGSAGAALAAEGDFQPLARAAAFQELRTLSQQHGAEVVCAEDVASGAAADAVVTDRKGLLLGIQTADCVPILLFDARREVVGGVHAGWRGTAAGVGPAAVRALGERYGTRPADLVALLGPAIGPCCYEVGPEVLVALERAARGAGAPAGRGPKGGTTANLWRANRLALEDAGLRPDRVLLVNHCTRCRPDLYPSFRRDGPGCGRVLSFIGMP